MMMEFPKQVTIIIGEEGMAYIVLVSLEEDSMEPKRML